MNLNYKQLIRDIIIAVLSAILTFLTATSCSVMWIKGNENNPVLDNQGKLSADSSSVFRVGTGRSI